MNNKKRIPYLFKVPFIIAVDFYAYCRHFKFPKKYTWKWKLEMLLGNYENME